MKCAVICAVFLFILFAQESVAQVSPTADGSSLLNAQAQPYTLQPVQKADSVLMQTNDGIDRVNAADTVIYNTVSKTDTLLNAADEGLTKLQQAADFPDHAINGTTDSIQFINKAQTSSDQAMDSLNQVLNAPADKVSEIEQKIENPTIGRVNSVTSEVNEGLGNVGIQHGIEQQQGIGASEQLRPEGPGRLLPGTPEIPGRTRQLML